MTPTVAVGAFIFDAELRVVLVQRGTPPGAGLWTVPGGKQEFGETLEQAVAREVREETGLVIAVGPLECVVERIGEGFHYVILDYLARSLGGELVAADDARDAMWASPDDLARLPLTEGLAPILERARATYAAWSGSRSPSRTTPRS